MKTEWELALEQERKHHPDQKIDSNSFLAGWHWGGRFTEYCRWFKEEYWEDYIKGEGAPAKTDPAIPAQDVP